MDIGKHSIRHNRQKNRIFSLPVVQFSLLFALIALTQLLAYWGNDRSMVGSGDAAHQHYPALAYYGAYLRQGLGNLLAGIRPAFPAWDLSLGLGGDVVTTLHYYCLGDPLALLSVFFPTSMTALCYTLLIFLRLYLAGLAAIAYFRHHNAPGWSSVIGALVYSFSGYALSPGVFHPFFSIPMIYFPLLLLGTDLIFEEKNPCCFILAVGGALISNFYFFYTLALVTVVYAVIRYFSIYGKWDTARILRLLLRFLGYALVGMLLAMPVFLPNLLALLSSSRLFVERTIPPLYPLEYYKSLPAALVSYYDGYYVYLSVSAVAVIALFVMLALPKNDRGSKAAVWALALSVLFLCIPGIGSALNGFSYVTNRWIWAFIFLLAYLSARYLPRAGELSRRQLAILALLTGGYCLLCMLPSDARSMQTLAALTVLCALAVLAAGRCRGKVGITAFRRMLLLLAVATLIFNGVFVAAGKPVNAAANHEWLNSVYHRYQNPPQKEASQLAASQAMRFDTNSAQVDFNAAVTTGVYGTSFYFSMINPGTADFQHAQMLNTALDQQYRGLNNRSHLMAALGVGCYLAENREFSSLPYGFDIPLGGGFYEAACKLPIVYAFDSVCT